MQCNAKNAHIHCTKVTQNVEQLPVRYHGVLCPSIYFIYIIYIIYIIYYLLFSKFTKVTEKVHSGACLVFSTAV